MDRGAWRAQFMRSQKVGHSCRTNTREITQTASCFESCEALGSVGNNNGELTPTPWG